MSVDTNNTFTTDNGNQAIEVIGSGIGYFEKDVTWRNFGIPYIVREDGIEIPKGEGQTMTLTLTIEPGTTVMFDNGLGLTIYGDTYYTHSNGILNAQGTKENPITFTTSEPGQYWTGIIFKHNKSAMYSVLNYCTIEYGGNPDANTLFWLSSPSVETIKNSTIRYSMSDGIKFNSPPSDGTIHNCNIYGNALYDINNTSVHTIYAELNYWGTPNGPRQDLCSSAVVTGDVLYEAWLEEPFSEPFRFTGASASPTQFNPITGSTTIDFTISQSADWTLNILNQQFEKVWSTSGSASGETVNWDGIGDNGVVSGTCYYEIEAECSAGIASPAMGILNLGDQAIARITEPQSHSLFTAGAEIEIAGSAIFETGSYEVKYGEGESPTSWNLIDSGSTQVVNGLLATWDTTDLEEPTYVIKLDVDNGENIYSDLVTIHLLVEDEPPAPDVGIIYSYDNLHRLTKVTYPDGSMVEYSYDGVGNRQQKKITAGGLMLAGKKKKAFKPHLISFKANPTSRGVMLNWKTGREANTRGFNLYRKQEGKGRYRKINLSLIPSGGTESSGTSYSYTDIPPKSGGKWVYILEEVKDSGKKKTYRPVRVRNISIKSPSGKGAFKKSFKVKCD